MLAAFACALALKPVLMTPREIGPPTEIRGGAVQEIAIGASKASLFVPEGWKRRPDSMLGIHFHTAAWFIVSEYQRAGWNDPVLVFNLGQGSSVYAAPFQQAGSLDAWLEAAAGQLGVRPSSLNRLCVTSFSAGFGAVRQLVADPAALGKMNCVVLCDSLYGSLDSAKQERTVLTQHVAAWKPLVDKARKGDATFVITTSQITPEGYAGSWEVALALVAAAGGSMNPAKDEEPTHPLLRVYQGGNWHVWSYGGETPVAHMTHARRLGDILAQIQSSRAY